MLKKTLKISAGFISLILIWLLCAWLLPKITLNPLLNDEKNAIDIYVKSNGVHTDIVMPKTNEYFDWNTFIDDKNFSHIDTTYHYIAIGWGDKGFYLNTPTWADLKMKTVANALFGLGSTAMHVTYYRKIAVSNMVKKISISKSGYLQMVKHITQSFHLKEQKPQLLPHPSYGLHDNYFEATGTYGIFKTCNVWTGNTLKKANIPMGVWTPLEFGVMDNL
ncbi:MAG: TIGR02117 family protein [Bacteroidota bacterium]